MDKTAFLNTQISFPFPRLSPFSSGVTTADPRAVQLWYLPVALSKGKSPRTFALLLPRKESLLSGDF